MPRELKLERIEITQASRSVKDWFDTREKVDQVLPGILAHIKTTGETHTCPFHTHTKPPKDAPVVYIAEFAIPKKFRDVGRLCPCPCCWEEFPKFGIGRVAWFNEEQVIRIIGEHCFKRHSPDSHRAAEILFTEERKRRSNIDFLMSNLGEIPRVLATIEAALPGARAVEYFHELLHDRLKMVKHNLWPHVMHGGTLMVSVMQREFKRDDANDIEIIDVETLKPFATIDSYQMLNPKHPRLSNVLERAHEHLKPYDFGTNWRARVDAMTKTELADAANLLSKAVRAVMDIITRTNRLRKFEEPVVINTLKAWGADPGCPIPFIYQHDGGSITFGTTHSRIVGVPINPELRKEVRQVKFWLPKGSGRYELED